MCRILDSEVIVVETPYNMKYDDQRVHAIKDLLGSLNLDRTRIAWEMRNEKKPPRALVNLMIEYNLIHCADLSREEPLFESDQIYTRLFGKGKHNIYQFSDQELLEIESRITRREYKRVRLSFHGIKMYKDALRYKMFKEGKNFPSITKYTCLEPLRAVLEEDTRFPSTKQELIESQGWKIIDITKDKRSHAADLLRQFPEGKYLGIDYVIKEIKY
jgi:hypothetical protein